MDTKRQRLRRELGPNLTLQLMEVSLQLEAESAHVPDDDFGVFLDRAIRPDVSRRE